MSDLELLLNRLWEDYVAINPQARAIHDLLGGRGETIVNDHIALRTFDDTRVNVEVLATPFIQLGYQPRERYEFPEKKLRARHYEHPAPYLPKVFISELKLADFSPGLREKVEALLGQMEPELPQHWDFPVSGRPWKIAYAEYEALRAESEYAAWMAAFGFRANHFTVLVNALRSFASLQELNDFLKQNGFELNTSGGEIKGSAAQFLEQSSTLASKTTVEFTDGPRVIPGCYYEFARRYPLEDGTLFSGFVTQSADKIFESTHKR